MTEKKKSITIYANCIGSQLLEMFCCLKETSAWDIHYISNYEYLHEAHISPDHLAFLKTCDYFIYQPFNHKYPDSEYDAERIQQWLKPECILFRVNYYRFRGFWYQCTYRPYIQHDAYKFLEDIGIHENMRLLDGTEEITMEDIHRIIHQISLDSSKFETYFQEELDKFARIDAKSDVFMIDFFQRHYKTHLLFYDPFHPTPFFVYEIFRQLLHTLFDISIPDPVQNAFFIDQLEGNVAWSNPVLPCIQDALGITDWPEKIPVFPNCCGTVTIPMDVFDYYYCCMKPSHLQSYIDRIPKTYTHLFRSFLQTPYNHTCPELEKDFRVIPIGLRCTSAIATKSAGLRQCSLPFDWLDKAYPIKVRNVLEADFADFIPDVYQGQFINKYEIHFPHFNPDLEKGIQECVRRMDRFRSMLQTESMIFFVYVNEDYLYNPMFRDPYVNQKMFEHMEEVDALLASKVCHQYKILYIDFVQHESNSDTSHIESIVLKSTQYYACEEDAPFHDYREMCGRLLSRYFCTTFEKTALHFD